MTRLVFFDVAGTLVTGNPWAKLVEAEQVSRVRVYAMYPVILPLWVAKRVGLITDARFRQGWIRAIARLLWGMHRDELAEVFRWLAATRMAGDYRGAVVERLREHKAAGDRVILISGMFTGMTRAFAEHVGADDAIGTDLAFDEAGVCMGRIVGTGCAGEMKAVFLKQYLAAEGVSLADYETFAYADSYSDVPLLSLADHATATYPDDDLAAEVAARGWGRIG